MKDMVTELPGLSRVRARFIEMLGPRQEQIAMHAIAAWDGKTAADICDNLDAAKAILHQIAGSAGSLGMGELGEMAHQCENEIIAHLKSPEATQAICPGHVINNVDQFLENCRALL
jgi:HPt (histidine-containing phosphotransfer) domain-containing protein